MEKRSGIEIEKFPRHQLSSSVNKVDLIEPF
jgi:hypothetical protein